MSTHIKRDPERDDEVAKDAVAFTLTKPVDPALLDAELSAKMNWRKDGGIVTEGDVSRASPENPVSLWVLRGDVDAAALRSVVSAHETPDDPEDDLQPLREKALAGEEFSPEESQAVLRALVLWLTR